MPTETELLAQKLRDVVEALIGADAALESRIVRIERTLDETFSTTTRYEMANLYRADNEWNGLVGILPSEPQIGEPKKRAWWRL